MRRCTRGPGDPSGRPGAGLPQRSTVRFACSCVCAPCNSSAGLPHIIILGGFRHLLGMWVPPPARSTYCPETRRPAGAWPFASSLRRGRRGELRSGMWVPPPCPGSSAARRYGERLVPGLGLLFTPGRIPPPRPRAAHWRSGGATAFGGRLRANRLEPLDQVGPSDRGLRVLADPPGEALAQ